MYYTDILEIIYLIIAVITFCFFVLLWYSDNNVVSSKLIGTVNFQWSLMLILSPFFKEDLISYSSHFYGINEILFLILFPLSYLFEFSFFRKIEKIKLIYLLHFLPAIFYIIILSPFYFQSEETKSVILEGNIPEWMVTLNGYIKLIVLFQSLIYTLLMIKILTKTNELFSNEKLMKSYKLDVILWSIAIATIFIYNLNLDFKIDVSIIFYSIMSFLIIHQSYYFLMNPELPDIVDVSKYNIATYQSKTDGTRLPNSFKNSKELQKVISYIEEEKVYLNKKLTVQDLVVNTGLSKHRISELFNKEVNKSFYDIINAYRIEESIRLIEEGKHMGYTLVHIADKSGFNSKTTFYRVFKKIKGVTPNNYILDQKKIKRPNKMDS